MIIFRAGLISIILCVAFLARTLSAEDPERQKAISEIQEKLAAARNEVERLLAAQADIYDQLDKVETELELSSRLLRELRKQSRIVAAEIMATSDTISQLQQLSLSENVNFVLHLRGLYENGLSQETFIPFAVRDTPGKVSQSYLYRRLVAQDKVQLARLSLDITGRQQLLTTLMTRKEELVTLADVQRIEERRAKDAVRQRERLLAKVKGEQRQKQREINGFEESSQLLGDIVAALDLREHKTTEGLWQKERELAIRMKGRLYWPVDGNVITAFGTKRDSRSGLSTKSNGINIATTPGAKVVAALTGEVLYIGWARGLEKFVVVDHGGSIYSLYGNLDQLLVSEGDQVIRGEQFAVTAGTRLHFEIREGKLPVDPVEWLRK